jgi:four helix bundle protein
MGFQNTKIYGRGLELVGIVPEICSELPSGFGFLGDQLRRASTSIVLNFAEGYGKSPRDQRRFFNIARQSANEVLAALDCARELRIISAARYAEAGDCCDHLIRMLTKFRADPAPAVRTPRDRAHAPAGQAPIHGHRRPL